MSPTSVRQRTAYHEAGHALAALVWPGNLDGATIVPDAAKGFLGKVFRRGRDPIAAQRRVLPTCRLTRLADRAHWLGCVRVSLAGLAAEEVVSGERPDEVLQAFEDAFVDVDWYQDLVDAVEEMIAAYPGGRFSLRRMRRQYDVTLSFLHEQRERLDNLAAALLEHETLDRNQIEDVVGWIRTRVVVPDGGLRREHAARVKQLQCRHRAPSPPSLR